MLILLITFILARTPEMIRFMLNDNRNAILRNFVFYISKEVLHAIYFEITSD